MAQKRKISDESELSKKSKNAFWFQGLKASMEDPNLIVDSDDLVVIIKDKYPKAKHHYLILPKVDLPNLKSLRKDHLSLLKHMHEEAVKLSEKLKPKENFRYGYHCVPSMSQLHLHLISQDFNSPCLKTKKHWNSFNTEYFIDSEKIINQIESQGCVESHDSEISKELLKAPLRCHVCKIEFPTMPKLKIHICQHC